MRCELLSMALAVLLMASQSCVHGVAMAQATTASQKIASDIQRAQAALRANDQTEAETQFRDILRLDPSNVEAHANLGVMAFFHGDCPAASGEFESALRLAPSLSKARALLSICERRMGSSKAQTDMEKSFAELKDDKLRVQVGMALADLYYQQADLSKAASVLHDLASFSPDNLDVLFFEQRVYSELADSALNKLALLAPASARMEQLIAERLINAGDLKDAIVHYRKVLAINPNIPGVHFELAESLMEGSPNDAAVQQEASRELDAASKADGDSAKVESERARIAMLQSHPEQALADYRHALELSPGDVQAEIGIASLLKSQDKPQEAAQYLRMAIAADPLNAEAHYSLSLVARQLHREEEQKSELKIFLELRASQDNIKALFRQMVPAAPPPSASAP